MKKILLIISSAIALSGATNAQTIINGSFEINDANPANWAWGNLTGWTESSGARIAVVNQSSTLFGTSPSGSGNYYLEVQRETSTGSPLASASISQTLSLVAGLYTLSFDSGDSTTLTGDIGGLDSVGLSINDGAITSYAGVSGGWKTHNVNINHGGGDLKITFTGDGTNHFGFLDNVSIEVAPEPSSTALLGFGALGLIARRKR